jgi:tRNA A37 threonylcarbamoyladenosine biosynthesis protein TsaE
MKLQVTNHDYSKQERAAEMITALTNFRDAYRKLLDAWELYDLNDTEAIQKYPFEKSFDELTIVEWCNETINEISK